jgi:hypothetical protein
VVTIVLIFVQEYEIGATTLLLLICSTTAGVLQLMVKPFAAVILIVGITELASTATVCEVAQVLSKSVATKVYVPGFAVCMMEGEDEVTSTTLPPGPYQTPEILVAGVKEAVNVTGAPLQVSVFEIGETVTEGHCDLTKKNTFKKMNK